MISRKEIVKATIAHRETARIPYCIAFSPEGERRLQKVIGPRNVETFVDNDIIRLSAPWWSWHELGPEWQQPDPPSTRGTVIGYGSYNKFLESSPTRNHEPGDFEERIRR